MKSKRYTIIGIVAIVSLIFFVVVTFCGKGHQWSNNVVQGFKSLGLKGNVKVIRTYKEIEAFYGTVVEVNYTEKFSDGYFLDKNLRADIREFNGEHISDFYPPLSTKIEALLNDKEKDLFDTVKFNEFSFLLDVYKMRPGFQREEDKIKKDVANKINKLFDRQVTFDYSYKFEPVSREKIYATILSQAVRNRDNGDFEAAGFYNIRPKNLMKNKAVSLHLDCIFASLDPNASKSFSREHIDYFKTKLLSLPKGSFFDGIYEIRGNYYSEEGESIDVTCIFVVEDGVGHFEEDKMN